MIAQNPAVSVSVVIGSYNAEDWIQETLRSVLEQTYPVLEVLVVDDGSTDRTQQIVESFGGKVKYVRGPHRGWPHRNQGILASRGEFIAFIDADDCWDPRKIELQMALAASRRLAWVVCRARSRASGTRAEGGGWDLPVPDGSVLERLLLNNFIASATPVIARHVFDKVGYFNETPDGRIGEDWDLWLRIAALYPLGCVQEPLATVRLHRGSFLATTPLADRVQSLEGVVVRAVAREPDRLRRVRGRALANIYYSAGVEAIRAQRYAEARGYFGRGLKYRPMHAEAPCYLLLALLGAKVAVPILQFKRYLWKIVGRLR